MEGIPKIVMQTWKTNVIPDHWKSGFLSVQKMNPTWQHVLMTDQDNRNFIESYFPEYLVSFDLFPYGIQRADFVRYAWLYLHGGVYLDLDYEVEIPFEYIIESCGSDFDIAIPSLVKVKNVSNSFIISRPRCSFWIRLMDDIVTGNLPWFVGIEKHLYILNSTGPKKLTTLMERYSHEFKFAFIPSHIIDPLGLKGTLVKNLEGMSWVSPIGKFFFHLYERRFLILVILVILTITVFYRLRS